MKARNTKTGKEITILGISKEWGTATYIEDGILCQRNLSGEWEIIDEPAPKESDDLEEAADEYAGVNYDCETEADAFYHHIETESFKAGAEWQKTQMMKEAVEGYVNYYEDSGGILMAEAQVGCPYHIGDKVKIIILKDDNERTPHNMD